MSQITSEQQDQVNGPAITGHTANAPTPAKWRMIATSVQIAMTTVAQPIFSYCFLLLGLWEFGLEVLDFDLEFFDFDFRSVELPSQLHVL